jgi:glycosyltransferase 2 family protein
VFQKYKSKIIYSIIFGALVFLGLSIYANFGELLEAFSQFNWLLFPFLLVLSFCNYSARFLKWDYYTKVLDIKIDRKMSFIIFLSSFIMAITPGKIGEVFKSYLLKEQTGTPISKSAPIIIAERITDFLSLILLSIAGAVTFNYGKGLIITIGGLFILLILLISSKKLSYSIINFLEKFKYFSNISHKIHSAYDSIYRMVRIKELIITIFLSIFAWFFECTGFYIVINGFNLEAFVHINIFVATFVYGFATVAGAVTMLPGGLGATDASITGLLIILTIPKNIAVASTLLIRVATLWFAVIVGIVAVLYYQRISHKKLSELVLDT